MDGLDKVRQTVNGVLFAQADKILQEEGWVHLYGVSQAAALLASRRGLDGRLCAAAGLMHDIYTFRTGMERDHAKFGAQEAMATLNAAGEFSSQDIGVVVHMIERHSDKQAEDGRYEECLKDADVLAHWLYDCNKKFDAAKKRRLETVFRELGLNGSIVEE